MGVLWTVLPLDEKIRPWFAENGIPFPPQTSRLPTGREIRTMLAHLREYDVEISEHGIGDSFAATIIDRRVEGESPWAVLLVSEYSGDDDPQELWFEKGHVSLIIVILRHLAAACGPLVLIPDTGEEPTEIEA